MEYEGITKEQQEALVDILKNCPLCVIRDTLIDAHIIDETFPNLYNDMIHGVSVARGYLRMGDTVQFRNDTKKYKLIEIKK